MRESVERLLRQLSSMRLHFRLLVKHDRRLRLLLEWLTCWRRPLHHVVETVKPACTIVILKSHERLG
jgi:hypothetical protein